MLPGGQHRIVTLTKPQIRNVDTVDEQVEVLENTKIGCPGNNQTSVILGTGRGRFLIWPLAPEWVCSAAKLHAMATVISLPET